MEDLEPLAFGVLDLKPWELRRLTIGEITAMLDGYEKRREALEDMFIIFSALPTYHTQLGNKAPTYNKLTAYRKQHNINEIPDDVAEHWRMVLNEVKQDASEH